jgi:hypothetical protein
MPGDKTQSAPKVFISYSHDSEDHKAWVKELACKLRQNGIDAILDIFTHLGSDLSLFMEQGLSEAHRVLCICSKSYNEKANGGIAGVNYEKRIICKELMRDTASKWVIPVIKNNLSDEKLPLFLTSLKYISFEDDSKFSENYYNLLCELFNQNLSPPLGQNPFLSNKDIIGKVDEMNTIIKTLSSSSDLSGKLKFNYLTNSRKYTIGCGINEFTTYWSDCGSDSVYAYSDHVYKIAHSIENININAFNISDYDFSSRAWSVKTGESILWINKNGKVLVTKIENVERENSQKHWLTISYVILSELHPLAINGDKEPLCN